MCSRIVANAWAERVARGGRAHMRVEPGQKCSHCRTSLDACHVLDSQ